jgi:hypothetical protein
MNDGALIGSTGQPAGHGAGGRTAGWHSGLSRDPSDLRDQIYTPTLRLLSPEADPGGFAAAACPADGCPSYPIRNQGDAGTCVGQALANLIDIHRRRANVANADPVSPQMLYLMARRIEGRETSADTGVQSLRSAVKGFYHFGCCPDRMWPDPVAQAAAGDLPSEIERYKAARGVTLGAYYRVRPILNDYHNALVEADGILVSAEIHEGWRDGAVSGFSAASADRRGRIPVSSRGLGAHAFVILGYTSEGFLVLNSWGADWGGFRDRPGIALWKYEDWARNVMDAWVLRLGVPAPEAFQYSVGDQGISFGGADIRAGSTACHQLLGHFAHLDDGVHVERGSYATSRDYVAQTTDRLRKRSKRNRKPVLLSVSGSLMGMKDAFDFEARRRQCVEDICGMYPYAVLWCNDLIESATPVLTHLFSTAVQRVGPHSDRLNAEIEKVTAGIGRAFWREIERAARTAGRHVTKGTDGAAAEIFDRFAAARTPLHLVIEGAGALLIAEYLESLNSDTGNAAENRRRKKLAERFHAAVASIDLIAPVMEAPRFQSAFGPLIRGLSVRKPGRATLWVPTRPFEERLSIDHYAGSMLDLVLYSFQGQPRDARLVGMSRQRSGIAQLCGPGGALQGLRIGPIRPRVPGRRRYEYHEVSINLACHTMILRHLARIGEAGAQQ